MHNLSDKIIDGMMKILMVFGLGICIMGIIILFIAIIRGDTKYSNSEGSYIILSNKIKAEFLITELGREYVKLKCPEQLSIE